MTHGTRNFPSWRNIPLLPSFNRQWEDFDFWDSFCASVDASGNLRQFTLALQRTQRNFWDMTSLCRSPINSPQKINCILWYSFWSFGQHRHEVQTPRNLLNAFLMSCGKAVQLPWSRSCLQCSAGCKTFPCINCCTTSQQLLTLPGPLNPHASGINTTALKKAAYGEAAGNLLAGLLGGRAYKIET